jgi:hypothetical protein
MPERFVFPDRSVDGWVPFAFTPEQMSDNERGNEFAGNVGRLRSVIRLSQSEPSDVPRLAGRSTFGESNGATIGVSAKT